MPLTPPTDTIPPAPDARRRVVRLLLAVAVCVAFAPLFGADFSWWDDQKTLHQNALFNPPTLATLARYWSAPAMGLYVPVTYTVWAAIAKLAFVAVPDEYNISLNATLFHAANVGLHVGSTWMVYAILRRLLPAATPVAAGCGALLFALHPLQVESVAWISGMKDLLCWTATLAVVLIYVRRVRGVEASGAALWRSRAMPLAAFVLVLGVLSKPTAMVAPAALLAIDGLLLRRRWARAAAELSPLFAISAAAALVARLAQVVNPGEQVALWQRPLVVGDALAFYVAKFAWPLRLTIDYGRTPTRIVADPWTIARCLLPLAIAAALVAGRRRWPALAAAGAVVAIGVAPVSGVATFQMQEISTTADHYLYFSMLGPALALAWALGRWPTRAFRAAVVALLVAWSARSFDQCRHWRTAVALIEHAAEMNPDSVVAWNNFAAIQIRRAVPRLDLAAIAADRAIAINPKNFYAMQTYAIILARQNRGPEAVAAFERLWARCEELRIERTFEVDVADSAFDTMMALAEPEQAIVWADRQVALEPRSYKAQANLASARQMLAAKRAALAATRPATTTTTR